MVTRLREAHGVVLGKTRMHELAYGITTINPDNGTVLNPYNNLMHSGGSSGGTAAIIAARGKTQACTSFIGSQMRKIKVRLINHCRNAPGHLPACIGSGLLKHA